jgi:putative adhesin
MKHRNEIPGPPVYVGMNLAFRTGTAVLACVIASACMVSVDSQGQIVRDEKRFTVSGVPDLRVSTFDGSIEIRSWDGPDVLVEIEKRGATREAVDALEVKTGQDRNRIELEVKRPRSETFTGIGFHHPTSARLIVSVPRRVDVSARSGDGSIRVDRLEGRLELRTGDGSIRAIDVAGDIVLNTGDGSVTVDGAEGRLELETGDGGVNVTGKLTAVKMHTGDGSIVYRAQPGTAMSADWDISTGDGSVSLYLPPDFGAELDAHTGDGGIANELDITSRGEVSRRTIRGRLGAGGKLLRVRTGDGSIRLRAH